MRKFYILITMLILLGLVACVPTLTREKVNKLRKGMEENEVKLFVDCESDYTFNVKDPDNSDKRILVYAYQMSSGTHQSDYFLMYRDKKLFYWGYPHEFARSSNKAINEAGKDAVEKLKKLKGASTY